MMPLPMKAYPGSVSYAAETGFYQGGINWNGVHYDKELRSIFKNIASSLSLNVIYINTSAFFI